MSQQQQQQQQLPVRTDNITPPSTAPTHTTTTNQHLNQGRALDIDMEVEMGIPTPPLTPHSPSTPTSIHVDVEANNEHTEEDTLVTPCTPTIVINPNDNDKITKFKCDSPSPATKAKIEGIPIPPIPYTADFPSTSYATYGSLHAPLKAHLNLLHPSTPEEVIDFCTVHLLSKERPYGYPSTKEWTPLYLNHESHGEVCGFDLSTAGLGLEASPSLCARQRSDGPGKLADERLSKMYAVVRESYRLLQLQSPGRNSAL